MNFFKKWFHKNTDQISKPKLPKQDNPHDNTYVDIIISLNKNNQIDFSLFIDDNISELPMTILEYSVLCSEFLDAVISSKMKNDTINILDQQIKTEKNKLLINNIVSLIKILDKPTQGNKNNSKFIKPSEVFNKHII